MTLLNEIKYLERDSRNDIKNFFIYILLLKSASSEIYTPGQVPVQGV
jgi:hypothetical protein